MAEIQMDFIANADVLTNIKQIRSELAGMSSDHKSTTEELKKSFQQAAQGADSYDAQLAQVIKKEKELQQMEDALVKKMKELEAQSKKSFGTGDVDKLQQKIKQLESEIQKLRSGAKGFGDEEKKGAEKSSKAFDQMRLAMAAARQELSKYKEGSAEFNKLSREIEAAEIAMRGMKESSEDTNDALESGRKKLQEYKVQLQNLALAGLENTQVYKDLRKEAGDLDDAIRDVNEEIKSIGSDTGKIDQVIRGIQLGTAAFGAYEGVVALTGLRNETLEKSLVQLNAAMTIANSLQTIMTELRRKDSVFIAAQTVAQKVWAVAVGQTTGAVYVLRAALATIGIGIIIAGVVVLVEMLTKWTNATKDQTDAQNRLNSSLEATLQLNEGTLDAIANFTEKRIARMEAAGASAQEIREAEIKGLQDQLAQQQKLEDQQREAGERALFLLGEIAEGRVKADADLIESLQKTTEIYNNTQEKRYQLEHKLEIQRLNNVKETRQEIADFEEDVEEQRKQRAEKAEAAAKARYENLIKLERQLAEAKLEGLDDGRQKDIATEDLSSSNTIKELERERDARGKSRKEIALYNELIQQERINHFARLLAIDQNYFKDANTLFTEANQQTTEILQTDQERQLQGVENKYTGLLKIITEARKKIQDLADTGLVEPGTIERLNQAELDLKKKLEQEKLKVKADYSDQQLLAEQELAILSLEALKTSGKDQVALTKQKEDLRLAIEKQYAEKRLQNLINTLGLEKKFQDGAIGALFDPSNIQGAAAKGVDVLTFVGVEIDDKEARKKILELINTLQKDGQAAAEPTAKFSLSKFIFGDAIGDEEYQMIADSFSNLFDQIATARELAVERELDAIDRRLDALDEEIEMQEDAADREKELMEEGVANNYDSEKRKLDDLKAQQELELKSRQDQMKKMEQIRKQEAALRSASMLAQGIEQAVNLTTAASEIFKAHSGIPFVGVALAIAAAATMVATFLGIKNSLKAATQTQAPQFKKGGGLDLMDVLSGASSHERGGVDVVDSKSGKKLAELEGDEKLFVINKGSAQKYTDALEAINNDDRKQLARVLAPLGVRMNTDISSGIVRQASDAAASRDRAYSSIADLQQLGVLNQINDHLSVIAENTTASTEHGAGYKVEKFGTHKRTIKTAS
jgi:hypothetical protein